MIDDAAFGLVLLGVIGVFLVSCIWRMYRAGDVDRKNGNAAE
jgi:hypothetical protein